MLSKIKVDIITLYISSSHPSKISKEKTPKVIYFAQKRGLTYEWSYVIHKTA